MATKRGPNVSPSKLMIPDLINPLELGIFESEVREWSDIEKQFEFVRVLDPRKNEPIAVLLFKDRATESEFAVKIMPYVVSDMDVTRFGLKDYPEEEIQGSILANEIGSDYFAQIFGYTLVDGVHKDARVRKIPGVCQYVCIWMEHIPYSVKDVFNPNMKKIAAEDFFFEVLFAIGTGRTKGFSHNDLHLGNIRLKKREMVRYTGEKKFDSKYQPCFIDFGRSKLNDTKHSDVETFISDFSIYMKRPNETHENDVFNVTQEFAKFVLDLKNDWSGSRGKGRTDRSNDFQVIFKEIVQKWYTRKEIQSCIVCNTTMNLQYCGDCFDAIYCSRQCQKRDITHKCLY